MPDPVAAIASWCGLGAVECGYGDDRCDVHLLKDERDRYREALEHISLLPHISASAGRRADFLAKEALRAD